MKDRCAVHTFHVFVSLLLGTNDFERGKKICFANK